MRDDVTLADGLSAYLKQHDIDLATLSRATGIRETTLDSVLSQRARLSAEMYFTICDALHISVDKIRTDE